VTVAELFGGVAVSALGECPRGLADEVGSFVEGPAQTGDQDQYTDGGTCDRPQAAVSGRRQ